MAIRMASAEASALWLPGVSSARSMDGVTPHLAPLGLTWLGWQQPPGWVAHCWGSICAHVFLHSPNCCSFIILAPGGFSPPILKTAYHYWPSAQNKLKFLILIVHVQTVDSVVSSLPALVPFLSCAGIQVEAHHLP